MNDITVIQNKIYEIRGLRVMLDFDLAALYQVETKRLKEAVRRNIERFEGDEFMFELTEKEYADLRSQIATSSWGGRRYQPFAFTELGVAMLSSVLRSNTAILVNRAIMKAFVAMRNYIATTTTLTAELSEIRAKLSGKTQLPGQKLSPGARFPALSPPRRMPGTGGPRRRSPAPPLPRPAERAPSRR